MQRDKLPSIRLEAKPPGVTFKPPASAIARFDGSIKSAAKADGEIEILGEIGETINSKMVKDQLKAIGKGPVLVTINSPGGDAFEGVSIYNLLREHAGKVTVQVLGLAASAASIIAMAGDSVRMGEGAFLMIHRASGIVVGTQTDMREFADILQAVDESVSGLYAARTGKPKAEILAMMEKETYLNASDALKSGFADATLADDKKKSRPMNSAVPVSLPAALLAAPGQQHRPVVRLSTTPPGASGKPRRQGVVYLKPPEELP